MSMSSGTALAAFWASESVISDDSSEQEVTEMLSVSQRFSSGWGCLAGSVGSSAPLASLTGSAPSASDPPASGFPASGLRGCSGLNSELT